MSATPPSVTPRRSPGTAAMRGLAYAVVVVMLPLAAWTSEESPNRVDRFLFEQMGQTILDGGTIYRDCWDNKPPGLPWLNAAVLAVGGRSTYAITAAAALAGIAAVLVTGRAVGRALEATTGALTAVVFALLVSQRRYDALTNGTEFYAMVCDAFAAAWVMAAIRAVGASEPRRCRRAAFIAGVAWGFGGLFKQTAAAGPLAVALACLIGLVADPARRRHWLTGGLAMAGGVAAVFAATAAALALQGVLGEAWDAAVGFNAGLPGGASIWAFLQTRMLSRQFDLLGAPLLLAGAGVFLALIPAERSGSSPPSAAGRPTAGPPLLPRPALLLMLLWLLTAIYGVSLGESRMDRYWHGVFVPLIWLAAQGVAFGLWPCRTGERRLRYTATIGVLVLGMVFLRPLASQIADDALRAYHLASTGSERESLEAVGRRVAELCPLDDSIYVVGYCAGVYRFSGRRCASRYAGLDKIDQGSARSQAMATELSQALQERRPAVILVEPQRLDLLQADRLGPVVVPGLAAWLAANYEDAGRSGRFHFFLRRGGREESPARATQPS